MTERSEQSPRLIPSLDELALRAKNRFAEDDVVASEDQVVQELVGQGIDPFDLAATLARESRMRVGDIPSLNGDQIVQQDEPLETTFKYIAADIIGARLRKMGITNT